MWHRMGLVAAAFNGTGAGCGGSPDPIMAQAFGMRYGTTESALCTEQPPGTGEAKTSRCCYKSLADETCFDRPVPDRKKQQLGTTTD